MTDLRTLTDAFTELEHRADTAPAIGEVLVRPRSSGRRQGALIAASVVGVAAVAGGAVLLVTSHGSSNRDAAGPPATSAAATSPTTPTLSASSAPGTTAPRAPHRLRVPANAAQLEADLRTVLAGRATFKVTYHENGGGPAAPSSTAPAAPPAPSGSSAPPTPSVTSSAVLPSGAGSDPYIIGRLDAHGARGGFDLQILSGAAPGTVGTASCDDPDRSVCTVHRYPDGSSLALGSEKILGARGSVTYQGDYVRSDGVEILMHLSNQADPKGESAKLGASVPFTLDQLGSIVRSPTW